MDDSFVDLIEKTKTWMREEFELESHVFSEHLRPLKEETVALDQLFSPQKKSSKSTYLFSKKIETAEILILNQSLEVSEKTLLERMGIAINKHIATSFLLEIPKVREDTYFVEMFAASKKARWLLISEIQLYQMPDLMLHYEKHPLRALSKIPVFLLADLKAYNADLQMKKSLWKSLLNQL